MQDTMAASGSDALAPSASAAVSAPPRHKGATPPLSMPTSHSLGPGGGESACGSGRVIGQGTGAMVKPQPPSIVPTAGSPTAAQQAWDVRRLLAGLQRGTVPGADTSVAFLCQKFTVLMERLQRAERGQQEHEQRCSSLEFELRAEEAAADGESAEFEMACAASLEMAQHLAGNLSDTQREERHVEEELCQARLQAEAVEQRLRALEEQCTCERSRLAQANSRIRHLQMSRPAGEEELRRLKTRVEALKTQHGNAEVELQACRERAQKDEKRSSELREAAREEEVREQASELAGSQREELSEARNEAAELKERLTEVQVSVRCCEDQLRRQSESKRVLVRDLQRREAWIAGSTQKVEGLDVVERGLELLLVETAEARSRLAAEEVEEMRAASANNVREATIADTDQKLSERTQRLEEVEREQATLRGDVSAVEAERRQLQESIEQLRHDQAAGGGMRSNLEAELRLLLAEQEQLRRDSDDFNARRNELHQGLALVQPALAKAKRLVRDLEARLDGSRHTAVQTMETIERLERETTACQDKTNSLRDENARLSERCTEFEGQLVQASSFRASSAGRQTALRASSRTVSEDLHDRTRAVQARRRRPQ